MPAKITTKEVAKQLHREYIENILHSDLSEIVSDSVPISYQKFTLCMMANDFISSPPTVRAKWDSLVASGILSPNTRGDRAAVNLDALRTVLSIPKKTYTHTQTCAKQSHGIREGVQ